MNPHARSVAIDLKAVKPSPAGRPFCIAAVGIVVFPIPGKIPITPHAGGCLQLGGPILAPIGTGECPRGIAPSPSALFEET